MRGARFSLLAAAAAILFGVGIGEILALPFNTPGGQTPLPLVRPAATAYTVQIGVGDPNDTLDFVELGRDDTGPYCALVVTAMVGLGLQPAGIPVHLVYRPLWDVAHTVGQGAAPALGVIDQEWLAIQAFAEQARAARVASGNGNFWALRAWVDPFAWGVAPPAAYHDLEFYKFQLQSS